MDMQHLVAGLVGLIGVAASASAAVVTEDKGPYSVTYDNATVFGKISFWYSQGANAVGFGWDVPGAVSLVSTHSAQTSIDIPELHNHRESRLLAQRRVEQLPRQPRLQ